MTSNQSSVEKENASETASTEQAASETNASETNASETNASETNASETNASETNAADQNTQAKAASNAAAENGTAESADAVAETTTHGDGSQSESQKAERRRVSLNPTVGVEAAKPVPSYSVAPRPAAAADGQSAGEQPAAPSQSQAEEIAEVQVAVKKQQEESAPPRVPVEVPPADESLDADLEAQINQALSGESAAPPVPVATEDSAESGQPTEAKSTPEEALRPGTRLKGTIQSVGQENVFLDFGFRSSGIIPLRQFSTKKKPEVGQFLDVVVDHYDAEEGLVLANLPTSKRRAGGNWDALTVGQTVDCMVERSNKGGLEVTVGGLRGFLPASQVELGFVSELDPYIGQKLTVQITEVNPKRRNLVVSRRAHLAVDREEKEAELWPKLAVGQTHEGIVKTIKDYGAFIDLGGIDGFLHIGEISWSRIRHPSSVLSSGQQVNVQIISLDPEQKKIGLGMKQLVQDPWSNVEERFPIGSTVTGKVTRAADFGAFVEIAPGVEGLIHISELEHRRVRKVTDVLREGQQTEAKVLEVDPDKKRVSLSLKALTAAPEQASETAQHHEPDPEPYQRKRKSPLKGGVVDAPTSGGGLFGNPSDFKK